MGVAGYWDELYGSRPTVWSGRVNRVLAEVAADLRPGRALDLGCGEGGDAVWLAQRGWRVTAVDVSSVAVERGRAAAAAAGVPDDRIDWVIADLAEWVPGENYDLVAASFLQSPVTLSRAEVLRRAAAAVAPGGCLLLVSHAAAPPWASGLHAHHHDFPTPESELVLLGLDAAEWRTLAAEVRKRPATGPDGEQASLDDTVVLVQRLLPDGERDVASELRGLEPIFHRSPAGSGREVFEAMLAPDYREVGASGRTYDRDFVLATVAQRYADGVVEAPLEVSDFAVRQLDGRAWLVTYALDQSGRGSRRATIWLDTPAGWQAAYHQGTLT